MQVASYNSHVSSKTAAKPAPTFFHRIFERRALLRSAAGLLLIVIGVLTLLSLVQLNTGGVVERWTNLLTTATGFFGALILALVMPAAGFALLSNRAQSLAAAHIVAGEIAYFSFLALVHSLSVHLTPYALVRNGDGGGAIGWVLAEMLWRVLGINGDDGMNTGRLLTIFIWLLIFAATSFLAARSYLAGLADLPARLRAQFAPASSTTSSATGATASAAVRPVAVMLTARRPIPEIPPDDLPIRGRQMRLSEALMEADDPLDPSSSARTRTTEPAPPAGAHSKARIMQPGDAAASGAQNTQDDSHKSARKTYVPRPDTLPPLDLLSRIKITQSSDADMRRQADIIETTLVQFGLAGKVVEIRRGPAVTQFGIEPGYLDKPAMNGDGRRQKVRVSQIAALQNDFALALAAAPIRIEAPIPGRNLVGIEVPNASITAVDLLSLMESDAFRKVADKSPLAFGLGKDVSGQPICTDLARMPHLLIAGTTGSGKSICISAITLSLVMNNRPEDLKMVMIDPKRVELSRFTGIPHIIGKPESEPDRTPAVLKWAVMEMERRYKRFETVGARNLDEFNESMKLREEEPLPRIVILIDELADMMMQAPVETEKQICRLAQMARATGMHMVVATQRPSVDVVTGLIKANFPARMSFAVASSADSRVILDQTGAETLLGRGDMLFMNPESGQPQRIQGCYVSEKDVENVIAWWKKTMQTEEAEKTQVHSEHGEDQHAQGDDDDGEYVANRKPTMDSPWDMVVAELAAERISGVRGSSSTSDDDDDDGEDKLIQQALEVIQKTGAASASLLQRKLRIGYPRAARLMEDLQALGHVGARSNAPTKPREVHRTDDDED
jgi:DNA segregation ATPase FtsK/SpoIIIE-like protein